MTHIEMLRRRSEILKRNIGSMILKDNKRGLSGQENLFYQDMVKKWHQNEFEIHAMSKKE
ncbi:hypothetical protein [Cohnella herbarum]|uniref:Uncharacterized protein n=1 Tax=Cohnella herbarum TaxID=2728023 RepID=A0A7Z2VNP5_9BACL|nr:hypothetical protein [Cohnella herbarum]QJD86457.1 hypothetical protein HH215_27040 [Cohnella herbarum]